MDRNKSRRRIIRLQFKCSVNLTRERRSGSAKIETFYRRFSCAETDVLYGKNACIIIIIIFFKSFRNLTGE